MPSLNDKLEIMELFDRYLLCLDERRFSIDEFAKIFTQDVKISMPSKMPSMKRANGLKELRDVYASVMLQSGFTHHVSSDYVFDFVSDAEANVRCNMSVYYNLFDKDISGGQRSNFLISAVNFRAVSVGEKWQIKELAVNVKCSYRLPVI